MLLTKEELSETSRMHPQVAEVWRGLLYASDLNCNQLDIALNYLMDV